jgi:serine/threonine protein kinase
VWPAEQIAPSLLDRFVAEVRLAGDLDHPNLARVLDAGDTPGGLAFVVTERLTGMGLDDLLERAGPLQLPHALHFACEVASALEALDAIGLAHRDLHPGQVFVERGGTARLLDVGQAALKRALSLRTPGWSSPEGLRGDYRDTRTDVHALALLLYDMLSGAWPFTRDGALPPRAEAERLLGSSLAVPLERRVPETPGSLSDLVSRALAKDPGDRPPLRAFARSLRSSLRRVFTPGIEDERTPDHELPAHVALGSLPDGAERQRDLSTPAAGVLSLPAIAEEDGPRGPWVWGAAVGAAVVAGSLTFVVLSDRTRSAPASAVPSTVVEPPRVATAHPSASASSSAAPAPSGSEVPR